MAGRSYAIPAKLNKIFIIPKQNTHQKRMVNDGSTK